MVLSGTKTTSSLSSITNQKQGGGSKKAGLPEQVGRTSWDSIFMKKTSQRKATLNMPLVSTVRQSTPIGF